MIAWKAWYTESREFEGKTTKEFNELPDDGVLAVLVFEDDRYKRYADGQDFYFAWKDTICCNNDPLEINQKRYPGSEFKRGMWTSDKEMKRIQSYANHSHTNR